MAAHTRHARRPKSGSARLNSSSATKADLQRLRSEFNQRKVDLVSLDLDVARTFADIAQTAPDDSAKRWRNRRHARQGYDAVVHFMQSVSIGEKQLRDIQKRLGELKAALIDLGEVFAQ